MGVNEENNGVTTEENDNLIVQNTNIEIEEQKEELPPNKSYVSCPNCGSIIGTIDTSEAMNPFTDENSMEYTCPECGNSCIVHKEGEYNNEV